MDSDDHRPCPEADAIEEGITAIHRHLETLGLTAMRLRNREIDRLRKQQERARQANAARWPRPQKESAPLLEQRSA